MGAVGKGGRNGDSMDSIVRLIEYFRIRESRVVDAPYVVAPDRIKQMVL